MLEPSSSGVGFLEEKLFGLRFSALRPSLVPFVPDKVEAEAIVKVCLLDQGLVFLPRGISQGL